MLDSAKSRVSIVIPVFNEEALLRKNVLHICDFLQTQEAEYEWEVLLVNDGSSDSTAEVANALAEEIEMLGVIHHPSNFGVGQALRFGFANTTGDYVISFEIDLAYDVNHITELLQAAEGTCSKIVLASPYMKGGTIKNVPLLRRNLSVWGNKFLRLFANGEFSTLTSMIRLYDGPFIRALKLRSMGLDIMPEMLYRAMILRARVSEIPGRLDWGPQLEEGLQRFSSTRLLRQTLSTILSGFILRPMLFFVFPGLLVGLFAVYIDFRMVVHFFEELANLQAGEIEGKYALAFSMAYEKNPHTFLVGFLTTMLASQLVGFGIISLQNKRYFDDLFALTSTEINDLKQPVAETKIKQHKAFNHDN